jgi:hypothetical protein
MVGGGRGSVRRRPGGYRWSGAYEWASCSATRAAAEAGIARLVGRREADDMLRQAEQFVGIVRAAVPVR